VLVAYDGLVQDITERKLAEIALRESEGRYRDFVEFLPQTVFELDRAGKIISSNQAALSMFGFSEDELKSGITAFGLLDPADQERARENVTRIMKGENPGGIEYTAKRKDGSRFPMVVYSSPRVVGKSVVGTRGIAIDISDRKKIEEALGVTNKKLTMLSSITRHDILNQLMGLRTFLELSKENEKDPELAGWIAKEDAAAEAIGRQIEFTRYYEDMGMKAPEWQDVAESIRSAASQIQLGEIDLHISLPAVLVYADSLIEKVFYNLIENSIRHGGHVTHISFSFQETEDGAMLVYTDDGIGIPAEDRELLFTRGFGKHTGLGLFLSREILAITGITIRENGEPRKGVRFEIIIPKGGYRLVENP
jgi:PAS domain S-box-containing protein